MIETHRFRGTCTAGPEPVTITDQLDVDTELAPDLAERMRQSRRDRAGYVVRCAVCGNLHTLERDPDDLAPDEPLMAPDPPPLPELIEVTEPEVVEP